MRYSSVTFLLLSLFIVAEVRAADRDRPNIVVIMADDLGYSDIGCYGSEIRTPNLDRLAAGGVRFTNFYNTGRCCPTRAALLTGLYPHQAGVGHMMEDRGFDGYRGDLNDRCVTVAQVLKGVGYATWMAGKWHVTKQVGHWTGAAGEDSRHNWPRQRGFERFFGTIHGAGSYYDPSTLVRDDEPERAPEGFYYTDAINDTAARFILEHKEGKPFFLYIAQVAPHWPLHAREDDVARYTGRYAAGWDALREERYKRMVSMGLIDPRWAVVQSGAQAPAWETAKHKEWQQRRMEVYAAQVEVMDRGIGRIIDALEKTGQLENTLVLFLADNGGCAEEMQAAWKGLSAPETTRDGRATKIGNDPSVMPGPEGVHQSYGKGWAWASNTPFRKAKSFTHEGGIASPLIAHWPKGISSRGELRTQAGHVIDLMATCVDVAGAAYPSEFEGRAITPTVGVSLRPAFEDKAVERGGPLFWEHQGNRAVREGKWKLVSTGAEGKWELYDLETDRTETRDLAAEQPERAAELKKTWRAWAERSAVLPWPYEGKK